MELPNLENLSLTDKSDDLSKLIINLINLDIKNQARLTIKWVVVLYADYDNDQFIFVAGPANNCYNIDGEYDWSRIADLELTLFYTDRLIYAELLYTSLPEIERWPVDFYRCANLHMILPDFSLTCQGFIEVETFENFLYDDSPGELTLFKDPLHGKNCKVPLLITK
jgi:hypothetical protein